LESDGVPAAAIPPKPSQAAVLSSMHTIRRLILSLPNHNQEEENDFETSAAFGTNRISLTNLVEDFYMDATAATHRDSNVGINVPQFNIASNVALELVNIFTRLHTRIAAASYASKFKLPLWSTRIKLGPRLIVCCLYSACVGIASKSDGKMSAEKIQKDDKWSKEDDEIVHVTVFSKLVQQMVHHSTTREVASGIYHFWVDYCDKPSEKNKAVPTLFRSVIHSMFEEIASPRECASLLRSILINTIQLVEMYPTTMNRKEVDRICTKYCMPYLKDCCLCILESSSIVREAFIHLIILSPSPSGEVCEQKLLTRCVALLLASCTYLEEGDDSDYSSDSDTDIDTRDKDDEVDRTQKQGMTALENVVLLKQLCNVSKIWCEPIFTTQTDQNQQRHVTEFILDGIDFMKNGDKQSIEQQNVLQELIQGVTNRLKVSEESVRIDGMQIGERIAPILGQSLKFDELDGLRDEDVDDEEFDTSNKQTDGDLAISNTGHSIQKEKRLRRSVAKKK
jgi:hypothetical protein